MNGGLGPQMHQKGNSFDKLLQLPSSATWLSECMYVAPYAKYKILHQVAAPLHALDALRSTLNQMLS